MKRYSILAKRHSKLGHIATQKYTVSKAISKSAGSAICTKYIASGEGASENWVTFGRNYPSLQPLLRRPHPKHGKCALHEKFNAKIKKSSRHIQNTMRAPKERAKIGWHSAETTTAKNHAKHWKCELHQNQCKNEKRLRDSWDRWNPRQLLHENVRNKESVIALALTVSVKLASSVMFVFNVMFVPQGLPVKVKHIDHIVLIHKSWSFDNFQIPFCTFSVNLACSAMFLIGLGVRN